MPRATPSPYDLRETLGLLWRNLAGPSRRNPAGVAMLPRGQVLEDIVPRARLGFGGDLMMMFGRALEADDAVREFLAGCDEVVLNFEGVITDLPKRGPDQKHAPRILEDLARIVAPPRVLLGHANNHAGDFGPEALAASAARCRAAGFRVFGLDGCEAAELAGNVRIVAGTQWHNRDDRGIAALAAARAHRREGAFNLLWPHWGHEMECFPRVAQVQQAGALLADFDAVVGHHSHVPQPVSRLEAGGRPRLVAWSLGDACFGLGFAGWPALAHYRWGLLLRCEAGPLRADPSHTGIGRVDWLWTCCTHDRRRRAFCLRAVPGLPWMAAPVG